ncbi:MAG: hypothetical protein RPR40_10955 [Bermanella sp.]
MILAGNSDIISKCEFFSAGAAANSQWLSFANGLVLVLQRDCLALYKDARAVNDELGNGLMELADLAGAACLALGEQGFVSEYKAGFVGLRDDKVILITPNDIQLFAGKADALRNCNELARLKLA